MGGGEGQSLLVRVRDEREEVLDLFSLVNAAPAAALLERLLGPRIRRLGPIRVSYVSRGRSDLQPLPSAARAEDLLATVNVEFHAPLPARLDVDGSLVFYLSFWLDPQGGLHGEVEGGSFHFRGGLPQGAAPLATTLERALRAGLQPLQSLLEEAVSTFARERRFGRLDLLPGRGSRKGRRRWGNADRQVVLAALPLASPARKLR